VQKSEISGLFWAKTFSFRRSGNTGKKAKKWGKKMETEDGN
jgi:hypothetical protein